jgi:hypothetical protein
MTTARTPALIRALRQWGLLAAASAAAASVWAAGLPEEGYLLDARLWQEEVAAPHGSGSWPADGWFRLTPGAKSVDVRAVTPKEPAASEEGSLYFRLPGATLKQGTRIQYRHLAAIAEPRRGKQYELALGKTRFGFSYAAGDEGVRYDIAYGGAHYSYRFAGDAGSTTRVRSIADLDGDAQPDFLVDVDDQTYLLLSTQARPGLNLPTAELWAAHDGC